MRPNGEQELRSASTGTPSMADYQTHPIDEQDPAPDYTIGEMILWLVGIAAIPLVPILMVWFLTPWSGM